MHAYLRVPPEKRVTQLTNKTNQFNVTTRRYTEAQIEALAANPKSWAGAFSLTDRMGDYGLIGVIFCGRMLPFLGKAF